MMPSRLIKYLVSLAFWLLLFLKNFFANNSELTPNLQIEILSIWLKKPVHLWVDLIPNNLYILKTMHDKKDMPY